MTTQTQSQMPAPASRPPFLVRRRTVFTWLVPLLLLAAVLTLRPHHGGLRAYVAGVAFVILGEIVRLWAAGYISKDTVVATGGPYAFVRNPLYFGSLLLSIGYGLASGFGVWGVLVLVALYLLFHLAAIFYEESFLKAKFGQPYLDYFGRVPRLLPSLVPRTTGNGAFSWPQTMKNREHVRGLIAVLFTALLGLRFLLH